jgi:hypothetical protein
MVRPMRPMLLAPLAVLALAACTADPPEARPAAEVEAEVEVAVPDGGSVGDVTTGADGRAHVLLTGDDEGGAGALAVVDPGAAEVTAGVALPPGSRADAVLPSGDGLVVAGAVSGTPDGFALWDVDPATGAVTATRPVAVPADLDPRSTLAAATPGGQVVVAVDLPGAGTPVLLVVDPATGAVTASAEVDLGEPGDGAEAVEVTGLAVGPARIAVTVLVYDREAGPTGAHRAVLATTGADLVPDGPAVHLAPDTETSSVDDVALAADGTAYAAVNGRTAAGERVSAVVAVPPGAGDARPVTDPREDLLSGAVTDVAVADGVAWLLHEDAAAGTGLTRVDLATGEAGAPLPLCDDRAGGLALAPDGAVLVAGECHGTGRLWVLR